MEPLRADVGRVANNEDSERLQACRRAAWSLFGVGRPPGAAPQLGEGSVAPRSRRPFVTELFLLRKLSIFALAPPRAARGAASALRPSASVSTLTQVWPSAGV